VSATIARSADEKELQLLVLSHAGYGKKTALKEFKIQKRGGSGIKCASVTAKTGPIIAARILDAAKEELVVVSKKSQVLRTGIAEIPSLGRSTQGVRIMKLRAGDAIASLICL
jgi:DNA gyrase subunit A